jgi:hypothetical protein
LYVEPDGRITVRPKDGKSDPIDTGFTDEDLKKGGKCE